MNLDASKNVRRFALALTAAVMVTPLISLVGWLSNNQLLASFGEQLIPMAPSTAFSFLLLSVALFVLVRMEQRRIINLGVRLVSGIVAAYGFMVAFAGLAGLPVNPDDLLFKGIQGSLGAHDVGRMSPFTGILFVFAGIALISFIRGLSKERSRNRSSSLALFLGFVVLITGAIFFLAYTVSNPLLYKTSIIPLALTTAISFLLLGSALTTIVFSNGTHSGNWYHSPKNIKIVTQLKICFGIILLLILVLGSISWRQSSGIEKQTVDMYNHPLTVRRAIGELTSDILHIRLGMKELILAESDQEIETILQENNFYRLNALKKFDVLYDRYLGPRTDIDNAYNDFMKWNSIRDETFRLRRAGKIAAATARSKIGGVGVNQAEILLGHTKRLDDFARTKGDQFMLSTTELSSALKRQLFFLIAGILGLSLFLVFFLTRNIRQPLTELTRVTKLFREGKTGTRSSYTSQNEFGLLSASFNNLADTIETELMLNTQAAQLAGVMLSEDDAHRFCHALLNALLEHTRSHMGAVYMLNEKKTEFEHFECIGMNADGCQPFSAIHFEGEFGPALATQKLQHITNIPEDSRFTFSTVSGKFIPREIITIPITTGSETVAVISLATLKNYSKNSLRLLNTILSTLSARVDGILAYRKIIDISNKLGHQNVELEAQKNELVVQASELTEQNIELEMQKKQLDEANQLKTSFLSSMSHELRTPLNSVIALSGVLNRRLAGKVAAEEYGYIDVIERNGKQLLALINDILDLSRIEAGREDLEIKKFNVNELVREVVDLIEPQATEKNITLNYRTTADLSDIKSDYEKCRHILQNLVANAVKFTEEGGVEITVEEKSNIIHIAVSDTGIGIEKKFLSKIFDEFRQADSGNSRKYGGTGLGLAIANKYTELLGGKITVESIPGEGSQFTLSVPVYFSARQTTVEIRETGDRPVLPKFAKHLGITSNKDKSLLLVEDNEAVIIQMKDMLETQGYTIIVANDGNEALDQIAQKIPDGMILDLMMPGVDGFEVLKRIRDEEETSQLPVIILTAKYITKKELAFLKHNQVHQLIQKGDINKDQLLEAVARMMSPEIKEIHTPPNKPAPFRTVGDPLILVVEDNPDNMLTIKALLAGKCIIVEAEDGQTAIDQAKKHQPHLILMDIALPGINGIEALREIRKEKSMQRVPVIAVSASAMKGDEENFMALGFDGYVSKPIDNKLFEKMLNEWIGK